MSAPRAGARGGSTGSARPGPRPRWPVRSSPQHQHRHGHHQGGGGEDHLRVPGDATELGPNWSRNVSWTVDQALRHGVEDGRPHGGRDPHVFLPGRHAKGPSFDRPAGRSRRGGMRINEDLRKTRAGLLLVEVVAESAWRAYAWAGPHFPIKVLAIWMPAGPDQDDEDAGEDEEDRAGS